MPLSWRRRRIPIPLIATPLPHAQIIRGLLEPLSRRRRTPAHAPLVATPLLQPLARAHVQIAVQLGGGLLPVDEVAETAADAALAAVEATARLAEIGDGGQLAVDGAPRVPAAVERVAGFLRVLFVLEAHVDVADEIWVWVSTCFGRSFWNIDLRSLLLSHTTSSSTSPYWHSSHQMSS